MQLGTTTSATRNDITPSGGMSALSLSLRCVVSLIKRYWQAGSHYMADRACVQNLCRSVYLSVLFDPEDCGRHLECQGLLKCAVLLRHRSSHRTTLATSQHSRIASVRIVDSWKNRQTHRQTDMQAGGQDRKTHRLTDILNELTQTHTHSTQYPRCR